MKCPNCNSYNIKVTDTRSDDNIVCRRRKCLKCDYVFYTKEEVVDNGGALLSQIHQKLYK